MDNIVKTIFAKVTTGKIDRETGLELLKSLKLQSRTDGRPQKPIRDIAIIGVSLRMPGAGTIGQYWQNIKAKAELIGQFPGKRQKDCEGIILNFTNLTKNEINYNYGGYLDEVDQFDHGFFNLSPREASLMDPNQRIFLETAWEAIEDGGYGGNMLAGSRTGLYLGYADWPVYGQYIVKQQPTQISAATAGNVPSLIAGRISYLLDLRGPAILIDTACSSSLVAVHLACMALKNEECDQAITGGVKVCLMPVAGIFEIGIESSSQKTCTFDAGADGTVWGEGAVAFLLKPLEKAMSDHDHIYAVIKGSAVNQDGASVGITAPNAAAQEDVIIKAWREAGIHPETITYIEAHGTGTKLGDPIEIDGIQRAFGRYTAKKQFCAISSVKTNIGHLDSASGVAGLAKAVAALKFKELPPAINFSQPNRKINFEQSPVFVNDRLIKWDPEGFPRRCGVSSFGFSGTNCHIVLEEAPELAAGIATLSGEPQVLVLSAKSKPALEDLIKNYRDEIASTKMPLDDICYTAGTGRGHYRHRLAIVVSDQKNLFKKLTALDDTGLAPDQSDGIYYAEHLMLTVQREIGEQEGQTFTRMLTTDKLRHLNETAWLLLDEIQAGGASTKEQLNRLAALYVEGAAINWEALYHGQKRHKIKLPVYPFQRNRCWVEIDPADCDPADCDPAKKIIATTNETKFQQAPIRIAEIILTGGDPNHYTPLERKLGNIYGQILGLKEINIYDNFFEIGGNSILAIQLETELEQNNLKLTTEDIYHYGCIKELAKHLGDNSTPETSATLRKTHQKLKSLKTRYIKAEIPSLRTLNLLMIFFTRIVFIIQCFPSSLTLRRASCLFC